jgi:hypothetical protein
MFSVQAMAPQMAKKESKILQNEAGGFGYEVGAIQP